MCFQLPKNHLNVPIKYTRECLNAIIIRDFIVICLMKKTPFNIFLSLYVILKCEEWFTESKREKLFRKREYGISFPPLFAL